MASSCLLLFVFISIAKWSSGENFIGEEGLPPLQDTAVVGGETRKLDDIEPTIVTNRTTTTLNCASGAMELYVEFTEPFFGIIMPNGTRNPGCTLQGNGAKKYNYLLPLKGCGTNRVERRVFLNNIVVRFHPKLQLENDEIKTIICRYPSPEVLPPPGDPIPIIAPPPPEAIQQKVGELEILLIICAILFLALLLVGMACSYTCLKRKHIQLIRKPLILPSTPSDITKLSDSSLIGGVKIPRAHVSTSESETLPSDYPSESPSAGSEVEDSVPRDMSSDSGIPIQEEVVQTYENQAYEEERLSSIYSDGYVQSEAEIILPHQMVRPPRPTFIVREKRAPTPPKTPEPDYPINNALSQSLTTILERDESFRGESIPDSEHALLVSEADEMEPPPLLMLPPHHEKIERRLQQAPRPPPSEYESVVRSVSEHDLEAELHIPPLRDIQTIENIQTINRQIVDIDEVIERNTKKYIARPPPSEPESDYPSETRSVTDMIEELPVVPRPPERTVHTVDDKYLSSYMETRVTEDMERHRRYIKQYHLKPKPLPPPPKWKIAIRHYPGPKYADELESSGPEWEAYSEPGSEVFMANLYPPGEDEFSKYEVETMEHPPPPNWNILIKVLEHPRTHEAIAHVLTQEDREKWRKIITTESTLRTMLSEATVREDFERIRHDQRYERLFEPQKWDVIIRVLSPPRNIEDTSSEAPSMSDSESLSSRDSRKKSEVTYTTTKRGSLEPVYEYDVEGNAILRRPDFASARSTRSSKSSVYSGIDLRSMTETEVNFARADTWSEASGPSTASGARSTADRSHTEMIYVPVLPDSEYPDTDYDDHLSSRTGRSLARSTSEFTEDWRHLEPSDGYSHVSCSSGDSRPRRFVERSTSEFFEEAPHLCDVITDPSPPSSPDLSERFHRHGEYESGDLDYQTYHRSSQQDYRTDRSAHSGREEVYSLAETEVSRWARKH